MLMIPIFDITQTIWALSLSNSHAFKMGRGAGFVLCNPLLFQGHHWARELQAYQEGLSSLLGGNRWISTPEQRQQVHYCQQCCLFERKRLQIAVMTSDNLRLETAEKQGFLMQFQGPSCLTLCTPHPATLGRALSSLWMAVRSPTKSTSFRGTLFLSTDKISFHTSGTRSCASRDSAYAEGLLVSTRFLRGLSRIPVFLPRDSQLLFADAFV